MPNNQSSLPIYTSLLDDIPNDSFGMIDTDGERIVIRGLSGSDTIDLHLLDADNNSGTNEKQIKFTLAGGGLAILSQGLQVGKPINSINFTGNTNVSVISTGLNSVDISVNPAIGQNIGSGIGIYTNVVNGALQFKTLTEGNGIDYEITPTEININAKLNRLYNVNVLTNPGDYNINKYDHLVIVKKTVSQITNIILPPGGTHQMFIIKDGKGDSDNFPITVSTQNGQLIDGMLTQQIDIPYESMTVAWDGTDWNII